MARKTLLTPKLRKEICEYIASPLPVKHACAMVGITETTFYKWIKESEQPKAPKNKVEFAESVARARAEASEKLRSVVMKAATGYTVTKMSGSGKVVHAEEFDWKAAAWLAERMFPDEFGNRQKLEHSVGDADARPMQFDKDTEAAARAFIAKATGHAPRKKN